MYLTPPWEFDCTINTDNCGNITLLVVALCGFLLNSTYDNYRGTFLLSELRKKRQEV